MGYKTLSENSCAVRAPQPANAEPRCGALRLTALLRRCNFFFFFFKETDLWGTLVFSTFVGSPSSPSPLAPLLFAESHDGARRGLPSRLLRLPAQGSRRRLPSQGEITASHGGVLSTAS